MTIESTASDTFFRQQFHNFDENDFEMFGKLNGIVLKLTQRAISAQFIGPNGPRLSVKTCWTVILRRHFRTVPFISHPSHSPVQHCIYIQQSITNSFIEPVSLIVNTVL